MRRRNSSNSFIKIVIYLSLIAIIAAGVFVYLSPQFEKNPPKISIKSNGFWNLKDKIEVSIEDESGIKEYNVYYKTNDGQLNIIDKKNISLREKKLVFYIDKINLPSNIKSITLVIQAIDNSSWNFFKGNISTKQLNLIIDRKAPVANVIANSYNIRRGGSAAVVVEVNDENLAKKYISFNGKYKFELIPYKKKGFYAAIIAWPVWEEEFKRVSLIAIDKANNETNTKVPLYIKDLKIKNDKIKISKKFVEQVSIPVLKKMGFTVPKTDSEIFVKQNRDLRISNIATIRKESLENMSKEMIDNFKIEPFRRLPGSKTFAGFAERRSYFYDGEKIDEAWHLGMDWASIKHATVKISNNGKVIYDDYLGIYGNVLIVDHGLGLQSLYAHTSKFNVQKGDSVKIGQKIANTGNTGAVFGDHLHFGVLIQGIESNPLEWMDKNWIKTRILNILDEANQVIRSKK